MLRMLILFLVATTALAMDTALPVETTAAVSPAQPPAQSPATTPRPPTATVPELIPDADWDRSRKSTAPADSGAAATSAVVPMLISLVVVVGLAIGLGWLAKRVGAKRAFAGRGRHGEVIETIPIGYKRSVTLLRVGDHLVLIGQGEHELSNLGTLPASALTPGTTPVAAAASQAAAPAAPLSTELAPPSRFGHLLAGMMGKRP